LEEEYLHEKGYTRENKKNVIGGVGCEVLPGYGGTQAQANGTLVYGSQVIAHCLMVGGKTRDDIFRDGIIMDNIFNTPFNVKLIKRGVEGKTYSISQAKTSYLSRFKLNIFNTDLAEKRLENDWNEYYVLPHAALPPLDSPRKTAFANQVAKEVWEESPNYLWHDATNRKVGEISTQVRLRVLLLDDDDLNYPSFPK